MSNLFAVQTLKVENGAVVGAAEKAASSVHKAGDNKSAIVGMGQKVPNANVSDSDKLESESWHGNVSLAVKSLNSNINGQTSKFIKQQNLANGTEEKKNTANTKTAEQQSKTSIALNNVSTNDTSLFLGKSNVRINASWRGSIYSPSLDPSTNAIRVERQTDSAGRPTPGGPKWTIGPFDATDPTQGYLLSYDGKYITNIVNSQSPNGPFLTSSTNAQDAAKVEPVTVNADRYYLRLVDASGPSLPANVQEQALTFVMDSKTSNVTILFQPYTGSPGPVVLKDRQTATLTDLGYTDQYHAWVDVQGQGVNNDYARMVGPDSIRNFIWLSVALAGQTNQYTEPGVYALQAGGVVAQNQLFTISDNLVQLQLAPPQNPLARSGPEWISLQTYVNDALNLPTNDASMAAVLRAPIDVVRQNYSELTRAYAAMSDSALQWKNSVYPAIVNLSSGVCRYANNNALPCLNNLKLLLPNYTKSQEVKAQFKTLVDGLLSATQTYRRDAFNVLNQLITFEDQCRDAEYSLGEIISNYKIRFNYDRDIKSIITDMTALNAELYQTQRDYNDAVARARATPSYIWIWPIGTIAAAINSGIYSQKANDLRGKINALNALIASKRIEYYTDIQLAGYLNIAQNSAQSMLRTLVGTSGVTGARVIVEQIHGMWNIFASQLETVSDIIQNDIANGTSKFLMGIKIDVAIQDWRTLSAQAMQYCNNCCVTIIITTSSVAPAIAAALKVRISDGRANQARLTRLALHQHKPNGLLTTGAGDGKLDEESNVNSLISSASLSVVPMTKLSLNALSLLTSSTSQDDSLAGITPPENPFTIDQTEWVAIQVYVTNAIHLPITDDQMAGLLQTNVTIAQQKYSELTAAYGAMSAHCLGWKNATYPSVVSLANDLYNYSSDASVYFGDDVFTDELIQGYVNGDPQSVEEFNEIIQDRQAAALKYANRANDVLTAITKFQKDTEDDQAEVQRIYKKYLSLYNFEEDIKSLKERIATLASNISDLEDEYEKDVIIAATTATYVWVPVVGIAAAAIVAGIYGSKAVGIKAAIANLNDEISQKKGELQTDIQLSNCFSIAQASIQSILDDLGKALTVVQRIHGMWNSIHDGLDKVGDDIKDKIAKGESKFTIRIGIKLAIKDWGNIQTAVNTFRVNAFVTITVNNAPKTLRASLTATASLNAARKQRRAQPPSNQMRRLGTDKFDEKSKVLPKAVARKFASVTHMSSGVHNSLVSNGNTAGATPTTTTTPTLSPPEGINPFSLSQTEWISIQTYVNNAIHLPSSDVSMATILGISVDTAKNDYSELTQIYNSMSIHCTEWKNATYPSIVNVANDIYNYSSDVQVYYAPLEQYLPALINGNLEAINIFKDVLDSLQSDAVKYEKRAEEVLNHIANFKSECETDQSTLKKVSDIYEEKYNFTKEIADLSIQIDQLNEELRGEEREYEQDVIIAATTPTYAWIYPLGTIAAVIVAGVYGDKAEQMKKRIETTKDLINNTSETLRKDVQLDCTFKLAKNSMVSILNDLNNAIPVIDKIREAWNTIGNNLKNLSGLIQTEIKDIAPILAELGIEDAIQAWKILGSEVNYYRVNAFVTIAINNEAVPANIRMNLKNRTQTARMNHLKFLRNDKQFLVNSIDEKNDTIPVSAKVDWQALYSNLTPKLPLNVSSQIYPSGSKSFTSRDLYINLNDLNIKIKSLPLDQQPHIISVYADVVYIPKDSWKLDNTALFIAARRIETDNDGKSQVDIDFQTGHLSRLIIYAVEIFGTITGRITRSSTDISFMQLTPFPSFQNNLAGIGILWSAEQNSPILQTFNNLQSTMLPAKSDYGQLLGNVYITATLLFDSNPEITRSMLKWIQFGASQSTELHELMIQATSLLSLLPQLNNLTHYVPDLDRKIYIQSIEAFVNSAKAFENQYEIFQDKNAQIEDRKKAAQLMLNTYKDTTFYVDQLITQCERNLKSIQSSYYDQQRSLQNQSLVIQNAARVFQLGIETYKHDKDIEMALKICSAVIEFAASIGEMLVTDNPAGAEGAVKAASEAAKQAKEMAQLLKTIVQLTKVTSSILKLTQEINDSANTKTTTDSLTSDYTDFNTLTDTVSQPDIDYWEQFTLKADSSLDDAIGASIDGARDYKLQLDIYANYGKSIAVSQQKLMVSAQELFRLKLQKQLSINQWDRLNNYINDLNSQQLPNDELMRLAFDRYMDVKRPLFIALLSYEKSYYYWALQESRFKPNITKDINEQENDLAQIQQDYTDALAAFSPPPQAMESITYTIHDTETLNQFSSNKKAAFSLDPITNSQLFRGDRVRLSTIRVWLDGAKSIKTNETLTVQIQIESSGFYLDTFSGNLYQFAAKPLLRTFVYEDPSDTHQKRIKIDGRVADEEQFAYFQPTPFTNWTITIPSDYNPTLDLSQLTQIRIEFGGSLIYRKPVTVPVKKQYVLSTVALFNNMARTNTTSGSHVKTVKSVQITQPRHHHSHAASSTVTSHTNGIVRSGAVTNISNQPVVQSSQQEKIEFLTATINQILSSATQQPIKEINQRLSQIEANISHLSGTVAASRLPLEVAEHKHAVVSASIVSTARSFSSDESSKIDPMFIQEKNKELALEKSIDVSTENLHEVTGLFGHIQDLIGFNNNNLFNDAVAYHQAKSPLSKTFTIYKASIISQLRETVIDCLRENKLYCENYDALNSDDKNDFRSKLKETLQDLPRSVFKGKGNLKTKDYSEARRNEIYEFVDSFFQQLFAKNIHTQFRNE